MNVGLDFDGVLVRNDVLYSRMINDLYGIEVVPEKLNIDMLIDAGFLTREEYHRGCEKMYGTMRWYDDLTLVDGVHEMLRGLKRRGHKVVIPTARRGDSLTIAQRFLGEQNIHIPVFSSGGDDKRELALELGLDAHLDDKVAVLSQLEGVVPHRFLLNWTYNARHPLGSATRIASLEEFEPALRTIYR